MSVLTRLLAVTAVGASVTMALAMGPDALAATARPQGSTAQPTTVTDPVSKVDPLIGTGSGGAVVGQVDTFPGADAPFGMLQWSPDTPSRPDGGGYNYADNSTIGFSLTHISGPGCAAYGDVPFLPTTGAIGSDPQDTTESFSHSQEQATPGYYQAELGSPAINSQISVNSRAGLGVFTYPATTQANMLIKAGDSANGNDAASVQVVGNDEVTGSSTSGHFCGAPGNYTVYFAAKFNRTFSSSGTWTPSGVNAGRDQARTNGPIKMPKLPTEATPAPSRSFKAAPETLPAAASNATEHPARTTGPGPVERKGPQSRLQQPDSSGPATGAWVTFDTTSTPVVEVQVSISYVSVANAEANLSADNPGWNLAALRAQTSRQWNQLLSKFQVGGGTAAEQATFYTALYHSFLHPNLFSDANGQYIGFDNKVHTVAKGQGGEYANYSGWDIYRSEVPLIAMADPQVTGDMMQSLVDEGAQGGWLGKWPLANDYTGVMNGDAADPILAEALAFGVRNFDTSAALAEMVKGATQVPTASELGQGWYEERPNLAAYEQLGYVPNTTATSISPVDNGTSETTEYAAADFSIAQFAAQAGNRADYREFVKRGQNWQNQFNPLTGYLQPRDASGNYPVGDPLTVGQSGFGQSGYQEGDAAQYNWAAPQNLRGLFNAMGGNAAVVSRLNSFFTQLNAGPNAPYYWAGNETDLNSPWVYDYAGAPYKTQQTVRDIVNTLYSDTPGGEPGNDDLGAMSSWYIWAALGMYPETPGSPALALGSPLFPYTSLKLGDGHQVLISAPGASADTPYVTGLNVNGRPDQQAWVSATQLLRSPVTTLSYHLSGQPDQRWGSAPQDAPPSYATGEAPAIGFLSSPEVTVAPGGTTTVKVGAQDVTGRPQTVSAAATPPSGLTASPRSGQLRVPADGQGTLTLTISAAPSTPQTFYTVPVALSDHGTSLAPVSLTVLVARPGSLLTAFNNEGISDDSNPAAGNLDGDGYSYSQQALAGAGLTPGGSVTVNGVPFTWPLPSPGNPDNAVADGQTVTLNAPAGTQTLGFLGSATNGPSQGMATLTYSDGSTAKYWLGLSDWTLNGGSNAQPSFGNTIAATMSDRNCDTCTGPMNANTYLFYAGLPVNPAKTLVSVTLPSQTDQGELHVFSIGTSTAAMSGPVLSGVSPDPASAGQTVTITGSGFGASQGSGYVEFSDLGTTWGTPGSAPTLTVDSWSDTKVTFTVPAPSGTNGEWHVWPGSTAMVEVVSSSGSASDTGVLDITPTSSMSDYYDNTGISSDANQSCADLDGDGYSFSADALAKAGVTAGGSVTAGGVTFTWPATCQPDNVLAAGQTILLPAKSGASTIGFLGTSTNGASAGPVTITYTDGTTSTGQLSFSDWAGSAAQGENTVVSIPYRNSDSGTSQQLTISMFEVSLPLTAGKTVASVTLPYIGDGTNGVTAMHIFAVAPGGVTPLGTPHDAPRSHRPYTGHSPGTRPGSLGR